MEKCKVVFYPENRRIEVDKGENLLRAAMMAEVHINASCGGEGTCGKCRVIVDKGSVKQKKMTVKKLSDEEIKEGYVFACLSNIESDSEIRVPVESRAGKYISKKAVKTSILSSRNWRELLPEFQVEPAIKKVSLELTPPSLEDNSSDFQRIRRELIKKGYQQVEVRNEILLDLPEMIRTKSWKISLILREEENLSRIEKVNEEGKDNYAVAVDLGTTTVSAQLINAENGEVAGESSDYNAQISCGEDVISRMVYAGKEEGLKRLKKLAAQTINKLIKDLIEKHNIDETDINSIYIAGNTIMLHLLAGINPKYIREAPYIPATNFGGWWKGKDFSLETAEASVYLMPCVASYMGGDITAGLISTGIFESEDMSLFIDIGTNGEIVFGNKEWLISCSCSAGPAFEGGGIQFGMRASRGAIEQVRINKETGEPMILTVGQSKPVGICGSGLIDLLAELFLSGIIDQKGKFNLNKPTERIRKGEHGNEYVLVWSKDSKINKDIIITEVDIDNLIRAKAAVFAGITILLESVNITFEAIEKIIIGGSFGNFLEVEKAVTIGLLPDIPPEKYYFVGNSSLHGAYLTALSKDMLKKSIEVARKMTYLELSENSKFMDRYVSAMFLPHTDLNLFPSIKSQVVEVSKERTREAKSNG